MKTEKVKLYSVIYNKFVTQNIILKEYYIFNKYFLISINWNLDKMYINDYFM